MISNSSPLIFLAKIGKIQLLENLFKIVAIPTTVKNEILTKEETEFNIIKKALEEWIEVRDPTKPLELNLDIGENHAISLAFEKGDTLVIDDLKAIKAAEVLGIKVYRTTSIILLAVKEGFIGKTEALNLIDKLIEKGYYISHKYYVAILAKLR